MIYLDNSATTYPKPKSVIQSLCSSPVFFGANPGRGGYEMSYKTADEIFKVRSKVKEMFNADSEENVIFTVNCTHALNMAIKGLAKNGGHGITSCLEHNSVIRPLTKLKKTHNFSFDIIQPEYDNEITVKRFERKIRRNTDFIVCNYASNVFGDILPIRKLGELAKKYSIPLIVDGAQAAGVIDIDVKRDNISCLCLPGHKGLYGPAGTGILVLNNDCIPDTVIEGGTGSESKNLDQPDFIPDRFESGTLNTSGIISLGKGIDFVNDRGIKKIRNHENKLISYFFDEINYSDKIISYNNFNQNKYVPIASFNVKGLGSEECAARLGEMNIAVRGGFHCNPLAHKFYNTYDTGTVRVSLSVFNEKEDIDFLLNCLIKIAKSVNV